MKGRNRRKNKSYLNTFVKNFMMVLFVPAITILLLYMQAEHIVKEQILISSHNTLNQFFRLVDSTLEEMSDLTISLMGNQECQTYARYAAAQKEEATYQTYVVKQTLGNMPREKYYDLFVYYPDEKRIISGKYASLYAGYYFDTYYERGNEEMKEQFDRILNCMDKRPTLFVMNRGKDIYLCVAMLKNYSDSPQLNYVAIVVLDPSCLSQMIEGIDVGGGSILMFDKNGENLFSSDSYNLDLPKEYQNVNTPLEVRTQQGTFVMQVRESGAMKGYYASVVPRVYFWKQLWVLRLIYGMGTVVCMLISVAVSWRLGTKTYRPLRDMVTSLQKQAQVAYNGEEGTEFEYIQTLFEIESERNTSLRRKVKTGESMVKERFLISLLDGNVPEQSGDDIFMNNGIQLCSDKFFVAVMQVEEKEEYEDIVPFLLKNVFCELCDLEHRGYVVMLSARRYGILVNLRNAAEEEELVALLQQGRAFLRQHYTIRGTIGTSGIHEGMRQIHLAYEEALAALQYRYLMEEAGIITYSKIKGREFQYPASAESRMFRVLMFF